MGCVHGRPSTSSPDRPSPQHEPAPAAAVAVHEPAVKPEQPAAAVEKPARKVRRSRSSRPAPGPGSGSFANRARGDQVAAGWPAWLSAVAGEAIDGWTPRGADSFEKIDKVRTRALSFPPASRREGTEQKKFAPLWVA
jgi:cyclin-dependent kinase 12/13